LRGATSTASARVDAGRRDLGWNALKKSSDILRATLSIRREPTCANLPPTCAFAV